MEEFFQQFFNWDDLRDSLPLIWEGFKINIQIFVIAEILVLIWGLALAMLRRLHSKALRPIKWLTIAYIDLFRGIPAIVLIFIVGFGLPKTGIPVVSSFSIMQLGILAL